MERRHAIDRAAFRIDDQAHGRIDAVPKEHLVTVDSSFGETGGPGCIEDEKLPFLRVYPAIQFEDQLLTGVADRSAIVTGDSNHLRK